MNKHEQAIRDYEERRQLFSRLEAKRTSLIHNCAKNDETDWHSKICLKVAFDDTAKMRKDNVEYYSFEEVLEEGWANGKYCNNCFDAYSLRKGALADARAALGNSKRLLSVLGKSLLKADQP